MGKQIKVTKIETLKEFSIEESYQFDMKVKITFCETFSLFGIPISKKSIESVLFRQNMVLGFDKKHRMSEKYFRDSFMYYRENGKYAPLHSCLINEFLTEESVKRMEIEEINRTSEHISKLNNNESVTLEQTENA